MKLTLKKIGKKIALINNMISEEEIKFLQMDYEAMLEEEENKKDPNYNTMDQLHIMIGFLGAWNLAKREGVIKIEG